MGNLFLVSTPIGNLKDITYRAIEVLRLVNLIVCEDTRVTGKLLKHYKIKKNLLSFEEHNVQRRIPLILKLLKNGGNIVLVSDAGTPTLSDPGYKLVRECIKRGIEVESIPGPSAILTALTVSGLPTDKFLFAGFPPKTSLKRKKFIKNLSTINYKRLTIIMFESPHRIIYTLKDMKTIFGDIDICLCRELTKLYEEKRREMVSEAIEHFKRVKPKGEITVVFSLNTKY